MTNRTILSGVLILFFLTALGCNNRSGQAAKDDKEELKTYKVTAAEIQTYIEATGSVQPDLAGTAKVLPQLAGIIEQHLREGRRPGTKGRPPSCHFEP